MPVNGSLHYQIIVETDALNILNAYLSSSVAHKIYWVDNYSMNVAYIGGSIRQRLSYTATTDVNLGSYYYG